MLYCIILLLLLLLFLMLLKYVHERTRKLYLGHKVYVIFLTYPKVHQRHVSCGIKSRFNTISYIHRTCTVTQFGSPLYIRIFMVTW